MAVQAATGARQINLRKWFFFATEITIAVIAGFFESYVYAAYAPNDPVSWVGAVARATVTQVGIVMFAVAAIRVRAKFGWGAGGWIKLLGVYGITAFFVGITAWFMRESALQFYQPSMLSIAHAQPIVLGNLPVLDGKQVDPVLIASFPVIQLALTWLAPLIVEDEKPLSLQEMEEAQQRELLALRFKAQKDEMNAARKRHVALARVGERDLLDTPATQAEAEAEVSTLETTNDGDGDGERVSEGKRTPMNGVWWAAKDLQLEIENRGYSLTAREVSTIASTVQSLGGGMRGDGKDGRRAFRGTPYIAQRAALLRWASKSYPKAEEA